MTGQHQLQIKGVTIPDPFGGDAYIEDGVLRKIEKAIDCEIDWDDPHGCGSFGCVFPTDSKDVVVKLSSDIHEGPTVEAILESGKQSAGIIEYYDVFKLAPEPYLWVILRAPASIPNESGMRAIRKAPWYDELVHDYRDVALDWIFNGDKDARDEALAVARSLLGYGEIYTMMEEVLVLAKDGILIGDLHEGNLGFDPHHPSFEWYDGIKRKQLQCFDVGFSSYPKGTKVKTLRTNPAMAKYESRIKTI